MLHNQSLEAVSLTGSWLTIGVFDGVHRGHQEIIRQLTAGAHASGAPAVLLTFSPHPAKVLAGREIPCLTTPEERAEILFSLGVDHVITLQFTRSLAERSAEDFMAELKTRLGLRKLLIGYDFALGRGRAGDFQRLSEIGRALDYDVQVVEAVRWSEDVISSTLIRQAIADGAVALAAVKLGRYYSVQGSVIPGDGRGRTIGIHTANVDTPAEKALPANGVYATWAWVEGQKHPSVTNIGLRPTFTGGEALPRIEAHLLDYSGDLYGKTLKLEFVERLRGEQKFPSVEALVAQIRADSEQARGILK
ncbi:MAG: bifunctional riboflavin kinase/FAD synthetase [Anaerolineales bacterium]